MRQAVTILVALLCAALPAILVARPVAGAPAASSPLPARLSATGLFVPGSPEILQAGVLPFSPQYPLWSDGSAKRRWIALPPGQPVDAKDPDAWSFPPGTRLWKEFRHDGRAVETRYIERLDDGRWRFAAYVWNDDGRDAALAPEAGAVLPAGPAGRYFVPSRTDCLACHEGAAVPVLGFSTLQLSPDRDPLVPHADRARTEDASLQGLVAGGQLVNLMPELLTAAPRIEARGALERAALGYMHGNCGHCHGAEGSLDGLDLSLAQQVAPGSDSAARTRASLFDRPSRFRPPGLDNPRRVAVGEHGPSTLTLRLRATSPMARMPPLGVQVADEAGIALIERWINEARNQVQQERRP